MTPRPCRDARGGGGWPGRVAGRLSAACASALCDRRREGTRVLDVTAAAWAATIAFIIALFAVDLALSGRRPHAVGFREAVGWSIFYIAVAMLFGVVFGVLAGWRFGAEYFAGY